MVEINIFVHLIFVGHTIDVANYFNGIFSNYGMYILSNLWLPNGID